MIIRLKAPRRFLDRNILRSIRRHQRADNRLYRRTGFVIVAAMRRLFVLFSMLWLLCGPAAADRPEATVFAAASLRGALETIAQDSPIALRLSFGGSGAMARQLAAGAPADLVILANRDWMQWLEDAALIASGSARTVTANRLVVIAPKDSAPLVTADQLPDRLGRDRLAMGQRAAVPAGAYARQWLEREGLWRALEDRLAETDNVRAALALVARQQTPFGIVYATDAQAEPQVIVVFEIPQTHHDPILYPAAALTPAGERALAHLLDAPAQAVFAAQGFAPVTP